MRMLSTRRAIPIFSLRPTIISSSRRRGWLTQATTHAWPKTLSHAAKATPPPCWSTVGDGFFQQVSELCSCRLIGGQEWAVAFKLFLLARDSERPPFPL